MAKELTFEQKIDYIYNDLRKKRMTSFLKWLIRLVIFGLIIHFYFFILPNMNKDKIMENLGNKIIDIVAPIVEKTVNSIDINELQKKSIKINNKG